MITVTSTVSAVVTACSYVEFHHMPDTSYPPNIPAGTSLKTLLKTLRGVEWGDMGGTHAIPLSDGSEIVVELSPAYGGGLLLRTQQAVRTRWSEFQQSTLIVRTYPIR